MPDNGKIIKFTQESRILNEGEMNLNMYKIIKGHVELYTGYATENEVLLGLIGPRSCFGEFGLLLQHPAIYTAIAYDDVYVLRVAEGEIGDFIKENNTNIIDIMRNMAHMMLVMQQQIEILAEEVKKGSGKDHEVIKQAKRNLRGYAIYERGMPLPDISGRPGVMNVRI